MAEQDSKELEALKYAGYQDAGPEFYDKNKKKLLIIKLGAMGDVLRTTPILTGLKKKYDNCMIYWLTKTESLDLLKNNPLIDKILLYSPEIILRLMFEKFDIVLNFEIDTPATLLANLAKADKKFGYFFDEKGFTSCYNPGAGYYLKMAFDDNLKLKNQKSYQEMMFEVAELNFAKEKYLLQVNEEILGFGQKFLHENNLKKEDMIIGINISAGKRWQSKLWSSQKIIELAKMIGSRYKLVVLGGPEEIVSLQKIAEALKIQGVNVIIKSTADSLEEFIGIINVCSCIITTDSLGLHISLALKKKTIALFFSTILNEVVGDSLIKIQSPLNKEFFYRNEYNNDLADSISAEEVIAAIEKLKI